VPTLDTLRRHATLWFAIVLLNGSVTFYNVWPTPKIRWQWHVSAEMAAGVCLFAALTRVRGRLGTRILAWTAGCWAALIVGRYAETVAPALYGREINLFWDVRHLGAVAAMLVDSASRWLVLGVIGAVLVSLALLYVASLWSWGRVAQALTHEPDRRRLEVCAGVFVVLFAAQQLGGWPLAMPGYAPPVSSTYARQARLLLTQLTTRTVATVASQRSTESDLTRVGGADVFLIFVESYGAVSYDRFARELADDRARFTEAIAASGRQVVSAFVDSPTFGGSSWLAHVSLMTGVEARTEDTNVVLMAQKRDTLVTTFSRHGYRTVAVMPGLRSSWPEGAFYGFDRIYDTKTLDYRGPRFGWWTVPDQFALARLDALEASRQAPAREPLFVFFPTTSTHAPFGPTAPYQPDWARVTSPDPYDEADVQASRKNTPTWFDLGPHYVNAVSYMYASMAGYLRRHEQRDLVMIVIGDHQPAAAVSGTGASWEVPVHVIAPPGPLLDRLVARGFRPGLQPARPHLGPMHTLLPTLLAAFGDTPRDTRGPARPARAPAE